jgi:hypothetical protein
VQLESIEATLHVKRRAYIDVAEERRPMSTSERIKFMGRRKGTQ